MRTIRPLLLLPLALILLVGCATVMPPEQFFEGTAIDFTKRLRWMDYHGAARHLASEHRQSFLQVFTPLQDLHITDVVIESADPQPDGQVVTANLMEYYILPSTTIRTFRFTQEWAYQPEGTGRPGVWRITTAFPEFPPPRRP